jgi:anthranilate/para-aminobenzoate synthase component I
MWVEPLEMAEQFADHNTLVLLNAARPAPDGSWRSLLAIDPIETITGGWDELATALAQNHSERWFGYLGYELGEAITAGSPASPLPFPPMWMTRFATVYVFDHYQREVYLSHGERSKSTQTILGEGVSTASKPSPDSQARRPLPMGEVNKNRIAMIGDNLLTDIKGGKAAGIPTILVTQGVLAGKSVPEACKMAGIEPDYVLPSL